MYTVKQKQTTALSATRLVMLLSLFLMYATARAGGTYLEPDDFIAQAFNNAPPKPEVIWLDKQLKTRIESILQHRYKGFRIRYWREGKRTAWILDEIGKDKPITTGIVVNDGRIEQIRVLVFRESRGWEVRHDFFTRQFDNVELTGDAELSNTIDNISGATLSVRALVKQAKVALLLHQAVMSKNKP